MFGELSGLKTKKTSIKVINQRHLIYKSIATVLKPADLINNVTYPCITSSKNFTDFLRAESLPLVRSIQPRRTAPYVAKYTVYSMYSIDIVAIN